MTSGARQGRVMSGRPTMRHVAEAAGVSIKTVSRVVNGENGVAVATAARVMEMIRQLDFQPNELARSLRPGRASATLGLVIGDISNPFYATMARAIEAVARSHQYLLVTGSNDEDPAVEEDLILAFCRRRMEGLIVVPTGDDLGYIRREALAGTHFVFVDRRPARPDGDSVVIDNVRGAQLAVEHLVAQGHRRIAMLGDEPRLGTMAERLEGYRTAMHAAGLAVTDDILLLRHHSAASAETAVRVALGLPDPPTAFFAFNNLLMLGAVRAARATGRDIGIVAFDDFDFSDMLPMQVGIIRNDATEMGRQAAELLFARLQGDTRPPQHVVLPVELVMRG